MKFVPRKVVVRAEMLRALEAIMVAQELKNPVLVAKQRRLLAILKQRRMPS